MISSYLNKHKHSCRLLITDNNMVIKITGLNPVRYVYDPVKNGKRKTRSKLILKSDYSQSVTSNSDFLKSKYIFYDIKSQLKVLDFKLTLQKSEWPTSLPH